MRYLPYVLIGAVLGTIHGLILLAAKTTFSSVIVPIQQTNVLPHIMAPLYKQAFTPDEVIHNSLMVTGISDIVIIITVISAVWWLTKLEKICLGE